MREEVEARLGGFPTKRHYWPFSKWNNTVVVWEREWESFAAMEAAYEKAGGDPETKALQDVPSAIIDDSVELFVVATDLCRRDDRCRWTSEATDLESLGPGRSRAEVLNTDSVG